MMTRTIWPAPTDLTIAAIALMALWMAMVDPPPRIPPFTPAEAHEIAVQDRAVEFLQHSTPAQRERAMFEMTPEQFDTVMELQDRIIQEHIDKERR